MFSKTSGFSGEAFNKAHAEVQRKIVYDDFIFSKCSIYVAFTKRITQFVTKMPFFELGYKMAEEMLL